MELPTQPGVYQDQNGRGFALYRGRWFFLVIGREVDWDSMKGVEYLAPLAPVTGNVEPDFKPFRARHRPLSLEEA